MNPETGKFTPLQSTPEEAERMMQLQEELAKLESRLVLPDGSPVPETWIVLSEGELFTIKDQTFEVKHIGESYFVAEPKKMTITPEAPCPES
jgi:hypothetical protein